MGRFLYSGWGCALSCFLGDKWGCALAGLFHVDGLGMEKCPVVLLKVLFDLKSGFLSKL